MAEDPATPAGGEAHPPSVSDDVVAESYVADDGLNTSVESSNSISEADRGRARRCYSIRSLGTLGGASSAATGINERGEVIGTSDTASGEQHAFLWSCGELHDLGTLGGTSSVPHAINDHGVVVGSSMLADGSTHAFIWRNGFMTDLGTPFGLPDSSAVSVNNRGQVVGNSGLDEQFFGAAFIWEHGRLRPLPPLIEGAVANAVFITESGRIFGHSNGFDQDFFSVVEWHHDRIRRLVVGAVINGASNRGVVGEPVAGGGFEFIWLDGQLIRPSFEPLEINDRGQVLGTSHENGDAVLWDHGDVTDLGGRSQRLINNRGEIVLGGAVWFKGVVTELPQPSDPATSFTEETGINDAGEIVGIAFKGADAATREAILWRPSRCHH